jgi:multimeric flavodoxin WrbA
VKAAAVIASARKRGNCYDFAEYMLEKFAAVHVNTELITLSEYNITPCQGCTYQCVQEFNPQKRVNTPCPITDDVKSIWEKMWGAEILLLYIPTYGGLPSALWVALSQRSQGIRKNFLKKVVQGYVVSAVVLASPHWSGIGERTPSIVADQIKTMDRKVAGFEVINNSGFKTENLFGRLIREEEIQRRLNFLVDRTLDVVKETFGNW